MSSSELFSGLFVPEEVRAATSDRAWVQALLDVEAALAAAEAEAGIVPASAAEAIAAACDAERFDPAALGRDARSAGTLVVPLAAALSEQVGGEAAGFVHWGATSQDAMDTAAMLVASRARTAIDAELDRVAAACARLAEEHRATPMAGRTLLQQGLPITFGLKAAGWLNGVLDAREELDAVPLAVQLGGAAGTLASLGPDGVRVLELFAKRLDLGEPVVPWHTARQRVARLGAALAVVAGTAAKIALDVVLMAQTEVGEVAESAGGGRGGSSTLPHKRNPVGSVLAIACARRASEAASALLGSIAQEHERAAGAWQAEWESLNQALAMTGGAVAGVDEALAGLEVRPERMRENLEATGGLLMAESVAMALAAGVGRREAQRVVKDACRRAVEEGRPLRDVLVDDPAVRAELSEAEVDAALDPLAYLGSASAFVERALERYGGEPG